MAEWRIEKYDPSQMREWDSFVDSSRNGTFLFRREYMEYHSDRFEDCSLLAFKNGKLKGVLPANISDDGVLHSHQGLTYGGWVTPVSHFDANDMMELWEEWRRWSLEVGITKVDYKPLPWVYSVIPAQEDIYLLSRYGAVMTECNLSSAIDLRNRRPFNTQQKRNLKKGLAAGGEVVEMEDPEEFHKLLSDCLRERHGASPVHTLEELRLLKSRFNKEIRFWGVRSKGKLEAGVCMYDTAGVAHSQYISSTLSGREQGLLTLLFDRLIGVEYSGRRYFDFGTSNEDHSRYLNPGLAGQKAALGGSGVAYTRWEIDWER